MKSISGREMCRLIEGNGWSLKRIHGSHHIYSKPGERKILSIPVHGNQSLKPGLAARIARDAGVTISVNDGGSRRPFCVARPNAPAVAGQVEMLAVRVLAQIGLLVQFDGSATTPPRGIDVPGNPAAHGLDDGADRTKCHG